MSLLNIFRRKSATRPTQHRTLRFEALEERDLLCGGGFDGGGYGGGFGGGADKRAGTALRDMSPAERPLVAFSFVILARTNGATWLIILILQSLQLGRIRHVHTAIFGLELVERALAQAVLATHLRRRHPSFLFFDQPPLSVDLFHKSPAGQWMI